LQFPMVDLLPYISAVATVDMHILHFSLFFASGLLHCRKR